MIRVWNEYVDLDELRVPLDDCSMQEAEELAQINPSLTPSPALNMLPRSTAEIWPSSPLPKCILGFFAGPIRYSIPTAHQLDQAFIIVDPPDLETCNCRLLFQAEDQQFGFLFCE